MLLSIITAWWFPWVAAAAVIAGIVRGIIGFGGALVLIPILSAFLTPAMAVPILNAVDVVAAGPLLPKAFRECHWKEVAPLFLGAVIMLPLGMLLLKHLDAEVLRKATAIVLLLVVVLMAAGTRLARRRTVTGSAGIGALSGLMCGSIGLSGPPIALFWLDTSIQPAVSRANIIVYTGLMTFAVIAVAWWQGLFDRRILVISLLLMPVYGGGIYLGGHAFKRMSGRVFRYGVLSLIAIIAVGTLYR